MTKKAKLMEQILRKRVATMSKEDKLFLQNKTNLTYLEMFFASVELEAMSLMLDKINEPKKPKKS